MFFIYLLTHFFSLKSLKRAFPLSCTGDECRAAGAGGDGFSRTEIPLSVSHLPHSLVVSISSCGSCISSGLFTPAWFDCSLSSYSQWEERMEYTGNQLKTGLRLVVIVADTESHIPVGQSLSLVAQRCTATSVPSRYYLIYDHFIHQT